MERGWNRRNQDNQTKTEKGLNTLMFNQEDSGSSAPLLLCNLITVLSYDGDGHYIIFRDRGRDNEFGENTALSTGASNFYLKCSACIGLHVNIPSHTCNFRVSYDESASACVNQKQGPRLLLIQRYWTKKPENLHLEVIN